MITITTPDGATLARNADGAYVPLQNIREIDKLRDEFVTSLVSLAESLSGKVSAFKDSSLIEAENFRDVSAQDHGIRLGGRKGGYSLASYDGEMKVVIDNATLIGVNEKVSIARDAIFACLRRWSEGSNSHLVTVVTEAFETNKQGHLSVGRLLAVRSYKIEGDPEWDAAMEALDAGLYAAGSKTYIRFYKRDATGTYKQIPLG